MFVKNLLFLTLINFTSSQYPFMENYPLFHQPMRNFGFQNQLINPSYPHLTGLQNYQINQMQKAEMDKLTTPRPIYLSNRNGVDIFMERLADKLPEITEKVIKVLPKNFDKDNLFEMKPLVVEKKTPMKAYGTQITRSDDIEPAKMVEINDSDDVIIKEDHEIERIEDKSSSHYPRPSAPEGPYSFINNLPSPDTIFGFPKLFGNNKNPKIDENEKEVDLINIKGIPIEKDEDEEVISYEKPAEKRPSFTTTKAPPPPPDNGAGEFAKNILSKFLKPEPESKKESDILGEKKKTAEATPENLLSALINGKLDKIDWISTFLGGSEDHASNPITQLFKGGIFGSATNFDAPMEKSGKIENREFH